MSASECRLPHPLRKNMNASIMPGKLASESGRPSTPDVYASTSVTSECGRKNSGSASVNENGSGSIKAGVIREVTA